MVMEYRCGGLSCFWSSVNASSKWRMIKTKTEGVRGENRKVHFNKKDCHL